MDAVPDAPLLAVDGLGYAYDAGHPVLSGVTFEVSAGELVALVGRNGAGKSTLLRCLAGWALPAQGEVRILGLGAGTSEREARLYVALVPDTPTFYDELTAWEHLQLVAQARRLPGWEARAQKLLEAFDLWPDRAGYPFTFSRGMRYKLALCLALTAQPRLLLLDEPLGPLDPLSVEFLWRTFGEQRAAGMGILLSSHQLPPQCAPDRYLVLERGRLIARGTPAELGQSLGIGRRPPLDELLRAAVGLQEVAPDDA